MYNLIYELCKASSVMNNKWPTIAVMTARYGVRIHCNPERDREKKDPIDKVSLSKILRIALERFWFCLSLFFRRLVCLFVEGDHTS